MILQRRQSLPGIIRGAADRGQVRVCPELLRVLATPEGAGEGVTDLKDFRAGPTPGESVILLYPSITSGHHHD